MRFILRFFSLLFLAAAVIVGIIDSIQSVASQTVVLTPLGAALFSLNPEVLTAAETYFQTNVSAAFWNGFVEWLLLQPSIAVFLVLSLLFWIVAFKRQPAAGRFAA